MPRFLEPSTWAGLGVILATVAPYLPGPYGLALGALGAALGGGAVYLRERGPLS
jgi:hypothetical protein